MTEEEKKEFEEFLKWKAEKAKREEQTEIERTSEDSLDNPTNEPGNNEVPIKNMQENSNMKDENSNTILYIAAAIVLIVVIFIAIGLSGSKRSS